MRADLLSALLVAAPTLISCAKPEGSTTCAEDGGAACFRLPPDVVTAYTGDGTRLDRPVLGCGGPQYPGSSLVDDVLSGRVTDPFGQPIADATVELFASAAFETPFATAVTDATGVYQTPTLPVGTPGVVFSRIAASGFTDQRTYMGGVLYGLQNPRDWGLVLRADFDAFAARVDLAWAAGTAFVDTFVYDCAVNRLEHVEVVISSSAGERVFVPGAITQYGYFAATPTSLDDLPATSDIGFAFTLGLTPGTTYHVQLWGFLEQDDLALGEDGLTLLGEQPFTVEADAETRLDTWTD